MTHQHMYVNESLMTRQHVYGNECLKTCQHVYKWALRFNEIRTDMHKAKP